jgi:hypothetical protein
VVQVFVTGGVFDGNLGGLAGADTACTDAALAANSPLTGTWTAWLSDNSTNAIARIIDGEYQLLNGTVVANNKADLTDGTLDAAIDLTENQNTLGAGQNVWTATDTDGTNPGVGTCVNWSTASNANTSQVGEADATDATWTDLGGGNTCEKTNHLYCFAAD